MWFYYYYQAEGHLSVTSKHRPITAGPRQSHDPQQQTDLTYNFTSGVSTFLIMKEKMWRVCPKVHINLLRAEMIIWSVGIKSISKQRWRSIVLVVCRFSVVYITENRIFLGSGHNFTVFWYFHGLNKNRERFITFNNN